MKIVKILGGLGNQMFQFALYTALRKRFPQESVLVDLHVFRHYPKHRGFELPSVFNADYAEASWRQVANMAYPYPNYPLWRLGHHLLPPRKTMLRERSTYDYEPAALQRQDDCYYDGYWQHEEYFSDYRELILKTFTFPAFRDTRNQSLAERLVRTESVSLHVRRGDYLTDRLFYNLGETDYYPRAIQQIQQETSARLCCVFSDDIPWCRQHLSALLNGKEVVFVDWNTAAESYQDMHLMTLCRHHIIANSSFSWWGAWLSLQEGLHIAPARWWRKTGNTQSPVPHHWHSL